VFGGNEVIQVHVITKNVYGNDLFYIKDKIVARTVMNLTGRKSVTGSDLQNLEELGITVTASEEATEALERSGSSWGADKVQFPYLWGDE
jgi:hypothetical protein|tara:strand:+ start:45 stop:314 length:270 start_codon:yes stop_codon:yes gene_type:complete